MGFLDSWKMIANPDPLLDQGEVHKGGRGRDPPRGGFLRGRRSLRRVHLPLVLEPVQPGHRGLSDVGLSLLLALFLVGLIQSGFNGSGLPVRSADVDYVFTSPVRPREVFAAKVLMNSFTTVLLSFPPVLALYFRLSLSYGTSLLDAVLAGLVTLDLPRDGAPPERRHHALAGVQHRSEDSGSSGTPWSSS